MKTNKELDVEIGTAMALKVSKQFNYSIDHKIETGMIDLTGIALPFLEAKDLAHSKLIAENVVMRSALENCRKLFNDIKGQHMDCDCSEAEHAMFKIADDGNIFCYDSLSHSSPEALDCVKGMMEQLDACQEGWHICCDVPSSQDHHEECVLIKAKKFFPGV